MNTRRSSFAGIPLIAVQGDLETAAVWRLAPLMLECLAPRGDRLIFDLSDCPYQRSDGIGLFLRILLEAVDGCWIAMVGANGPLSRVFELTGLARHRNFVSLSGLEELSRTLEWMGALVDKAAWVAAACKVDTVALAETPPSCGDGPMARYRRLLNVSLRPVWAAR